MLPTIYNQRITIFNKLKNTDNPTGRDIWKKFVLDDVAWYTKSARSAGGSTVYIGTYITILIPFHSEFIPYLEWKEPGMQDNHFTISTGDYIVLGDVLEDTITPNNIIKVMEKYGENVCLVRHHNALYKRYGATVQLKIEGV